MPFDPLAHSGQLYTEINDPVKFLSILMRHVVRMINILLAAFYVPSRGQQISRFHPTDLHIGPGWRNDQRPKPLFEFFIPDGLSISIHVAESSSMLFAIIFFGHNPGSFKTKVSRHSKRQY